MKTKMRLNNSGQDLVEFAIILPFLAVLIFGIIDLGRAAFYFSTIQNAAREGARYAVVSPNEDSSGIINRVKARVIGINPTDTNLDIGLGDDIDDPLDDWDSDDFVQVQVNYSFRIATPFVGAFFDGGMVSMSASSTMQRENWPP
jgi:hypothetical protein